MQSLSEYADARIDGRPAEMFLIERTARVIASALPPVGPHLAHNRGICTAALVHPDGYFLTAAHCLVGDHVHLVFEHAGRDFAVPARIVWRGDAEPGGPDLALLRARGLPLRSFRWADALPPGSAPVLAVGQSITDTGAIVATVLGGKLVSAKQARFREGGGVWLSHSAPLQGGDSGGPLTNTHGELLGINLRSRAVFPLLPASGQAGAIALRPDPEWIESIIREDAMRQRD